MDYINIETSFNSYEGFENKEISWVVWYENM
jgi:hypothetical protein